MNVQGCQENYHRRSVWQSDLYKGTKKQVLECDGVHMKDFF